MAYPSAGQITNPELMSAHYFLNIPIPILPNCVRPGFPNYLQHPTDNSETKSRLKSLLHQGIKAIRVHVFSFLICDGQQIFSSNSLKRRAQCAHLWQIGDKNATEKEKKGKE